MRKLEFSRTEIQSTKKGSSTLEKKKRPVNIAFQMHKLMKYCWTSTGVVALKTSDSSCYFLSRQRWEKGAGKFS